MKYLLTVTALLIGMAGTAYCQDRQTASERSAVHPGTALLDSMGIYAGKSQPADKQDTPTTPRVTVVAAPDPSLGKQQ